MKTSTIVNILIIVVILYLAYKAFTNYQLSGNIFRSSDGIVDTPVTTANRVIYYDQNSPTVSRFVATGGQQMDMNS